MLINKHYRAALRFYAEKQAFILIVQFVPYHHMLKREHTHIQKLNAINSSGLQNKRPRSTLIYVCDLKVCYTEINLLQ